MLVLLIGVQLIGAEQASIDQLIEQLFEALEQVFDLLSLIGVKLTG
jgi:hypothetical protein